MNDFAIGDLDFDYSFSNGNFVLDDTSKTLALKTRVVGAAVVVVDCDIL
jgi:hypothetical protein